MPVFRSQAPRRLLYVVLLVVAGSFALFAAKANAYVYWTNEGKFSVGRANTDGTEANKTFLSGIGDSIGLATDGSHIYWANAQGGIGRANLDGSSPEPTFISGLETPIAVTVDSGHIYWSSTFSNKIGRANLDGTGVEPSFITGGLDYPWQLASVGGYLYWAEYGGGSIAKAKLDGTEVNNSFISTESSPKGLVSSGGYLYWNSGGEEIDRAKLDGSEVTSGLVGSLVASTEIAVDGGHIYWTSRAGGGTIGRSNLDGSGIEREFITAGERPQGLALDAPPPPPSPPIPNPTPTPAAPGGAGPGASPVAGGTAGACVTPTASASSYTPVSAPGRVVPGVRIKLATSTPSQLGVTASLTYTVDGKVRKTALGVFSLHVAGSSNLRIALPPSIRSELRPKSKVQVGLQIDVTPDSMSGTCGGQGYERSASVATRVVNVLSSKVMPAGPSS